jgi:hypothetical protein
MTPIAFLSPCVTTTGNTWQTNKRQETALKTKLSPAAALRTLPKSLRINRTRCLNANPDRERFLLIGAPSFDRRPAPAASRVGSKKRRK